MAELHQLAVLYYQGFWHLQQRSNTKGIFKYAEVIPKLCVGGGKAQKHNNPVFTWRACTLQFPFIYTFPLMDSRNRITNAGELFSFDTGDVQCISVPYPKPGQAENTE